MKFVSIGLSVCLLVIGGCATTGVLNSESSVAAIRSAEELGAHEVPQAALYLELAKEELADAQALDAKGQEAEAASLMLRAEADAELAVALSRGETERVAAQAAVDRVRKLQSDNPYAPGGAN
jgi:regulator of protease activity HflC (stomatin/prohibitin superfamily)